MSFPQGSPRPRRPVVAARRRGPLLPTIVVLAVLVALAGLAARLSTDVLWYQQLGYLAVWRTELVLRILLFAAGAVIMAGGTAGALWLAYRGRPVYAPVGDQAVLDRYRASIEPLRRIVVIGVPGALGLLAGSSTESQWRVVLLWWNRVPFGTTDAQFHLDVSFFVFTLPWLEYVLGFATTLVFLGLLGNVITHYLYGGLRLQQRGPLMTAAARIQIGLLAGSFVLLRGLQTLLSRYDLTVRQSRLITGLTYTDANAVLTARTVVAGISVIVAVLFIVAAFVDAWRMIPVYGVVLLVLSSLVVGDVYPAIVQRFQVQPNQRSLEIKYIQRNIDATRSAYGLQDVKVEDYSGTSTASDTQLRDTAGKLAGVRLVDPAVVTPTFRQLQQNKQYYSFADALDVDRYTVDGQERDAVVAVRELNLDTTTGLQRNWFNDHLVYTHGFGMVAASAGQITGEGVPSFFETGLSGTGQSSTVGTYEPRVYFGEHSPDYSIVGAAAGTAAQELDYPDTSSAGERNNTYTGSGGVSIGGFWNRLLYALKFQDQNILLSSGINEHSRILYDRSPLERVQKVAPFLTLDGNPYPSIVDGRIVWILDGYTTSARYPNSSLQALGDVTRDTTTETTASVASAANQQVNYIRNSVKATVDAYDGSVTLYAWDASDPVLKAWMKAFPTAVKPMSSMSSQLMSHVRYPEDLFKVQREVLSKYHVTDPATFFNTQDFWSVAPDPTSSGTGTSTATAATTSATDMPPYYLSLQMPGQSAATYSMISSYVPTTSTGSRSVLTGFLAVDSDAGSTAGSRGSDYGTLRLLQLPKDSVPGPGQVHGSFVADADISKAYNIIRQGGASKLIDGNLLTFPLSGGLLFVEPTYVSSTNAGGYPRVQYVLAMYGSKIGFSTTLAGALDQVFGTEASTGSGSGTGSGTGSGSTPTPSTSAGGSSSARARLQAALDDAAQAVSDADAALKKGDFTAYGEAQTRLKAAITQAVAADKELGGTGSGSVTVSPTGTATATASPSATSTTK